MRVLAVNVGSSSLKLSVIDEREAVVNQAHADDVSDPGATLREFVAGAGAFDAVAHRMVHGGPAIRTATLLDGAVRSRLEEAAELAPLHVPPALRLLDESRATIDRPHVICVDTGFHHTLSEAASTYALPPAWRAFGVRRYGFHGLSYAWASRRAAGLLERPLDRLQMIVAHVGAGVSACAVREGRSVDTSMGFTPVDGAVMATRSGAVDPGALLWLQSARGVTATEMSAALEHDSGLLGLAGSGDLREVERRAAGGDRACAAALDVYIHVLARVVGGLAVSLQHLDALVFTGGVGEHSAMVRAGVCGRLGILGVPATLDSADGDAVIASTERCAVVVVTAREDAEMARETRRVLGAA